MTKDELKKELTSRHHAKVSLSNASECFDSIDGYEFEELIGDIYLQLLTEIRLLEKLIIKSKS